MEAFGLPKGEEDVKWESDSWHQELLVLELLTGCSQKKKKKKDA